MRWTLVVLLLLLAWPRDAHAEVPGDPTVCPPGNLFTARLPPAGIGAAEWRTMVDGLVVRAGAPWPDPRAYAVVRSPLEIDLGRALTLSEFFAQVDADDSFDVELSSDGAAWTAIRVAPDAESSGMIARRVSLPAAPARFVRFVPRGRTSAAPVAELAVRCSGSAMDPGALRASDAARVAEGPASGMGPADVDVVKLALATLALLIVLARRTRWFGSARARKASGFALGGLGVAAVVAYFQFGAYRYPDFAHSHDLFHYFVGAKYFPELGYDGLYDCAVAAETDAGFGERAALRSVRDLRTNELVDGVVFAARAGTCKRRFAPERWREFAADVRYFANHGSVLDWNRVLRDHGFNATPSWIAFGHGVARGLRADTAIGAGSSMFSGIVPALDPVVLALALGLVVWAFGVPTAGVALVVFGCNPLSDFSWIGGSFLRNFWLACLVAGICLLRRQRPALGGACLASAALLQLFPVVTVLAIAASALAEWKQARQRSPAAVRALVAAAVVMALGVPASMALSGRGDTVSAFIANTAKHRTTPAVNLVGLPSVLSYRSSTRAELLFDGGAPDPFARVRSARVENLRSALPLLFVGIAVGLALFARAVWKARPPPWQSAALGLALVPFTLETSSYYSAWLVVLSLVGCDRMGVATSTLVTVACALVAKYAFGQDASYVASSAVLVVAAGAVLATFAGEGQLPRGAGGPTESGENPATRR